eukprot:344515_1
MKSIIASLFTIYALASGNRRLLQTGAPGVVLPTGLPANTAPAATVPAWVAPTLPNLNNPSYNTIMECNLPNTAVAGCAGRLTSIENAGQNFKMTCSNIGACAASQFTFNFVNSMVERIEQISFSEQFAGYMASVTIDSTNSARKQYIDKLECKAQGACQGTTIKAFGGASVNDVKCSMPNYCEGCTVSTCEWGPNGEEICDAPKACYYY